MSQNTHPMILVAATSVTIASLAAAAYFTGLLPAKPDKPVEPTVVASAPVAPVPAEPVKKPVKPATPTTSSSTHSDKRAVEQRLATGKNTEKPADKTPAANDSGIDVIPARGAESTAGKPVDKVATCLECGTVDSVHEQKTEGEGTGLGAIAGGVLGGLLGNQVGRGNGRDVGAVVGAVGGALAGHQVEKKMRSGKRVEITVRMDDGSYRTIDQEVAGRWHQGDRVRIEQGRLQPY